MTVGPTSTTNHRSSRELPNMRRMPVSGRSVTLRDRVIGLVSHLRSLAVPVTDSTMHLFYVHSGITYVCARMVIAFLGLPTDRCILLVGRRMTLRNTGIRCEAAPEIDHRNVFGLERRFWRSWRRIARLDRYISRLCRGRDFVVYLPHSQRVFYQLILSHRRCRRFAFLEEGTDAYIRPAELDDHRDRMRLKLLVMSLLNYAGRANHYGRHYRAGYDRCYSITPQAFRILSSAGDRGAPGRAGQPRLGRGSRIQRCRAPASGPIRGRSTCIARRLRRGNA